MSLLTMSESVTGLAGWDEWAGQKEELGFYMAQRRIMRLRLY